ncbi:Outer-membrane lipoprotein carrier protein [Candidatus Erwinia haradaeae]|uniref:Outer-membrane lipoprotein carrier protein n=1 Tax=Candidatus Erwinia haradaeae TaxID=1922217 RepID=A0A451DGR4_9GAMM|nr:Outer-membrane lipoprotein carrier protein [Candidatus Erwinia haradaeae]
MNKILIFICLLVIPSFSNSVQCDTATILQKRLEKIDSFQAEFHQKVIDTKNTLIQEGSGYIWLHRPNQIHWKMIYPDESDFISDGNTLWFYSPSIKQVSIYCMKNIIHNTPLMLVIHNQSHDWKQYHLLQQGDKFIFTPKKLYSNIIKFIIDVSKNGNITQLSIFEKSGVCIYYILSKPNSAFIDPKKFQFSIPPEFTIDDHRK